MGSLTKILWNVPPRNFPNSAFCYGGLSPGYGGLSPGYGGLSPGYGGLSTGYGGLSPGCGGLSPGYGGLSPGHLTPCGMRRCQCKGGRHWFQLAESLCPPGCGWKRKTQEQCQQ